MPFFVCLVFAFVVPQWSMAVWEGSVRMLEFGRTGHWGGMGLQRLMYVGDLELSDVLI
jgi:hypothetical protein